MTRSDPRDETTRLRTARLDLRPVCAGDAEAMAGGIGDPAVARMLADCPLPFTSAMAKDWLKQSVRDWRTGRCHVWSIFSVDSLIGMINVESRADGGRTMGYWIRKDRWGSGYASEAATRIVDHSFIHLDAPFLVAGHFADNPASARVLAKLGFTPTRSDRQWCAAREGYVEHQHVRLMRESWAR